MKQSQRVQEIASLTLAMTGQNVSLRGDEVDEAIPKGARDCFVPISRDPQ
ncbi:MAG: hypothetical protein ACPL1A_10055 [Candidatus Kapaibacteriota bacterium]